MEINPVDNKGQLQLLVAIKRGYRLQHAFFTLIGRAQWMDLYFNPGEDSHLARLLQPADELVPELTLDGPYRVENEPLYGDNPPGRLRQWLGRLADGGESGVVRPDSLPPATHGRDHDLPTSQ